MDRISYRNLCKKNIKIWSIVGQSCDLSVKGKLVFECLLIPNFAFILLLPPLFCFALHGQGILDQTPYNLNESVVLALILGQAPIWLFSGKNRGKR